MKNTIAVIAAVACIHACAGFSRLLPLAPHSRSASALVPLRRLATQMTEDEAVADAALVARIDAEVQEALGVPLEQLMNPAKVVNLEREIVKLRKAPQTSQTRESIQEKEALLAVEKRTYMRSWLKQIFVGQAALSAVIAGLMAYDMVPFVHNLDLSIRVLGFWCIWLFTVPSLRARKPNNPAEKTALNYAFLATALTNLLMPFATKDPGTIYWANMGVLAACYAVGFTTGGDDDLVNTPGWLKFVYKSLDFGSGQERGARK